MIACRWCERPFEPHRGGSRQTFCRPACRAGYHKATRQWCERQIAHGRLTVEELRNSNTVPYTLPSCGEHWSANALLGPVTRFLIEVPRYTIDALIRFQFIGRHQQHDFLAILDAMTRLGQTPNVSSLC
jgi:hypothetical protein